MPLLFLENEGRTAIVYKGSCSVIKAHENNIQSFIVCVD